MSQNKWWELKFNIKTHTIRFGNDRNMFGTGQWCVSKSTNGNRCVESFAAYLRL